MTLRISVATGSELQRHIADLARLRISVFREYPYLYDGTEAYEARYLQTYTASGSAMAVLAFDGETIVGASTAIPMQDETLAFKQPFIDAGIDPSTLFYCGESVLLAQYRGQGIYKRFFAERENFARKLGGFEHSCFCGVVRPDNDSRRPSNYMPLDDIWQHFGYHPRPDLIASFSWTEVGHAQASDHSMMFWIKPLNNGFPTDD